MNDNATAEHSNETLLQQKSSAPLLERQQRLMIIGLWSGVLISYLTIISSTVHSQRMIEFLATYFQK